MGAWVVISAILILLFAGHIRLACVASCHAEGDVCFPLECCKHCLKVHRLLVVIISKVPSSLLTHSVSACKPDFMSRQVFYILWAWPGQKDGGFSSLLRGVQSNPQAQMGVLPGKRLCHRDIGHWCLCTYTYIYIGPNLSLSLFLSLASFQCHFLWFIIIFAFDSLTTSLMLLIGYQSDLRPVEAGDKWNRCFADPSNPDINSAVVCDSDQMIPTFLTYLSKC